MPAKDNPAGGALGTVSSVMKYGGALMFTTSLFAKGNGIGLGLGGALMITGYGLEIANMKK